MNNSEYRSTRERSIKKGREFSLSIRDFNYFSSFPCFYCGTTREKRGLDRVDNDHGYTKDNVVACCVRCNRMKSDMQTEDFYNHMIRILKKQGIWGIVT